jgi:hypothetical protein
MPPLAATRGVPLTCRMTAHDTLSQSGREYLTKELIEGLPHRLLLMSGENPVQRIPFPANIVLEKPQHKIKTEFKIPFYPSSFSLLIKPQTTPADRPCQKWP